MKRIAVSSQTLRSIGYDGCTMTMEVEFTSGSIYRYYNVPPQVYDSFMTAASKGTFLNTEIKSGYEYTKL